MLQFEEYKTKLNSLKTDLDELGKLLELDQAAREVDELEKKPPNRVSGTTRTRRKKSFCAWTL